MKLKEKFQNCDLTGAIVKFTDENIGELLESDLYPDVYVIRKYTNKYEFTETIMIERQQLSNARQIKDILMPNRLIDFIYMGNPFVLDEVETESIFEKEEQSKPAPIIIDDINELYQLTKQDLKNAEKQIEDLKKDLEGAKRQEDELRYIMDVDRDKIRILKEQVKTLEYEKQKLIESNAYRDKTINEAARQITKLKASMEDNEAKATEYAQRLQLMREELKNTRDAIRKFAIEFRDEDNITKEV